MQGTQVRSLHWEDPLENGESFIQDPEQFLTQKQKRNNNKKEANKEALIHPHSDPHFTGKETSYSVAKRKACHIFSGTHKNERMFP